MKGAPFRSMGGAVIADHGPVPLAKARTLAHFYASEALLWRCEACGRRAEVLREAVLAAENWRRAAGWADPDVADAALIRAPGGRRGRHATPPPRRREGR